MMQIERDETGWYWPRDDSQGRRIIARESANIDRVLSMIAGRGLIIQAGGNTGLWPASLARHFGVVVTAEPHPANYACLLANRMPANVRSLHAAFGGAPGWTGLAQHEHGNCGSYRRRGEGNIAVMPIDALQLPACDAIWLDVEGGELEALRGAARTIADFHPTIIVEDSGNGPSPAVWLQSIGYQQIDRVGNDVVWKR